MVPRAGAVCMVVVDVPRRRATRRMLSRLITEHHHQRKTRGTLSIDEQYVSDFGWMRKTKNDQFRI